MFSMFGLAVTRFVFEWIHCVKLIWVKIEFYVKRFIFEYIFVKQSWKHNYECKNYAWSLRKSYVSQITHFNNDFLKYFSSIMDQFDLHLTFLKLNWNGRNRFLLGTNLLFTHLILIFHFPTFGPQFCCAYPSLGFVWFWVGRKWKMSSCWKLFSTLHFIFF